MSEEVNALLVDVGNTRLKVSRYNPQHPNMVVSNVSGVDALEPFLDGCNKVFVSSVGEKQTVEHLTSLCEKQNLSLYVAKTEASRFGVQCAYRNYATLGVDRWLAVLAARSITSLPVAVLDLGTAATCDVVIGNNHVGGWIAPGFELMRAALINNTQHVFANQHNPETLNFADATEECVNMGCLSAIQGILLNAHRLLSAHSDDYKVIISGGDKAMLSELSDERTLLEENLVLKGLSLFV